MSRDQNTDEPTREKIVEAMIQQEIDEAWAWMLSDDRGKLILFSILEKCGLQNFTFNGNSWDALFKGRQQIGAEILADHVYPFGMHVYTDMLLQAEERQQRLEVAIEDSEDDTFKEAKHD